MMANLRTGCLIIGVLCLLSVASSEPRTADSTLIKAQTAFENGDFDTADLLARRGLEEADSLDKRDLIGYHLLIGQILVARSRPDLAQPWFYKVFEVNPDLILDPVLVPPNMYNAFERARSEFRKQTVVQRLPEADVRLAASWRSLIAPGWGQFYKQQDNKATAIIAAQVLSLAALIFAQTEVNRRHNDYLRIRAYQDPNTEDRYAEYRRAYQVRNVVGYVTLGIYLTNYLDALYYPVARRAHQ